MRECILQVALPALMTIFAFIVVVVTFTEWCRERMMGKPPWIVRLFLRPRA
ncbi:MAG: hypothetical protein WD490_00910 [Opitutales bacterium]